MAWGARRPFIRAKQMVRPNDLVTRALTRSANLDGDGNLAYEKVAASTNPAWMATWLTKKGEA